MHFACYFSRRKQERCFVRLPVLDAVSPQVFYEGKTKFTCQQNFHLSARKVLNEIFIYLLLKVSILSFTYDDDSMFTLKKKRFQCTLLTGFLVRAFVANQ